MKYILDIASLDYKLFEAKTQMDIAEDAVQKLKDNLIYLNDDGFDVKVDMLMEAKATISILITERGKKLARWSDIKDDVESAIESVGDRFYPAMVYYKFEGDRHTKIVTWEKFLSKDWEWDYYHIYKNHNPLTTKFNKQDLLDNKYFEYLSIELREK